ncbi:MAG: hypothetical protein HGB30_00705 [Holophagaceae bacterium]|nr:hypothetical protein [Holophagaceae bacterium]
MPYAGPTYRRPSEAGGITIILALMLLVLLTVAAVGMSRNALRDITAVGFGRQGAMARNVADSGLEWAIHWLDPENGKVANEGSALHLTNLKAALLQDLTLAGVAKAVQAGNPTNYSPGGTPPTDLRLSSPTGTTQGYTLGLTCMGKLPIVLMSQGASTGTFRPAAGGLQQLAPDLWAVRSDAQVTQGPVTFVHARELWISTPIQ